MMIKKLTSLALALVMCLSLCVPTLASVPNENIEAIESALSSIAFKKDYYGFEGIDITTVWAGSPIPAYEAKNGTLEPISYILFYPIFNNDGYLVSMAGIIPTPAGPCASITTDLVNFLNNFMQGTVEKEIALIYDNANVYCWDGESVSLLERNEAEEIVSERDTLTNISAEEFSGILSCKLTKEHLLHVSEPSPLGYEDEAYYTYPPFKPQGNTNWCWAGCMASVIQHETGVNYSTEDIARRYVSDTSTGAYLIDIKRRLGNSFSLYYNMTSDNNLVTIFGSLSRNHPVIGGFYSSTNHAAVIRGIDFGSNTFSVMDPASSGSSYRTGTISNRSGNTGTLTLTRLNSAQIYTMEDYLYM